MNHRLHLHPVPKYKQHRLNYTPRKKCKTCGKDLTDILSGQTKMLQVTSRQGVCSSLVYSSIVYNQHVKDMRNSKAIYNIPYCIIIVHQLSPPIKEKNPSIPIRHLNHRNPLQIHVFSPKKMRLKGIHPYLVKTCHFRKLPNFYEKVTDFLWESYRFSHRSPISYFFHLIQSLTIIA